MSERKKALAVFTRHAEPETQSFDTKDEAVRFLEQGVKDKEIQPIAVIVNYKVAWRYHNNRGREYTDDYINEIRKRAE
ncbi:hypothetical protein [Larkinella terrae]|uniref:Uncharacterized protein n=1 Tax=Larkinella terrae TaxID=2025311 RepID=A0A7K0ERS7_9BACT|nr:hypothetical protein [Larkinella terrae]MRS64138.1 hypothetical protein [Larkinella terrae]